MVTMFEFHDMHWVLHGLEWNIPIKYTKKHFSFSGIAIDTISQYN